MKPEPKKKLTAAQQIENARLSLVEEALIAFVEEVDGKVPTDDEVLSEGAHVQFADTPLSVHVQDGKRFTNFYVWRRKHAVALGFLSPKAPLELSIVRLHAEKWPTALRLHVEQLRAGDSKGQQC